MYRRLTAVIVVLLAVGLSLRLAARPQEDAAKTDPWTAVDEAINRGLPKTAIENLQKIAADALQEKAYAEAIKAISMTAVLEGNVQGNKPEEKLTRLEAEIEKAPAEMKPVMQAILANWYWHFLQQNRWRFMQRTQTDQPPSDDIMAWSLPRIISEVDQQFTEALASDDFLKSIPFEQYKDLFEAGNTSQNYRPTVYDVIAHNALAFYSSSEQVIPQSQDAFELSAGSPVFGTIDSFLQWEPEATDENALTLRAVQLYQDLLRFHLDDQDPSARLDTDLARLRFAYDHSLGDEKIARYKAALQRFADAHASHVISSRALHELAVVIYGEDELVRAREIALQGMNRHPESIGGKRCFNLVQQIESPSASAVTERVWNEPRPVIELQYKNLREVHCRLVRFDFREVINKNWTDYRWMRPENQETLLKRKPVKEWKVELPPTEDYRLRVEQIEVPDDLDPGSYLLVTSHNADFSMVDNQLSWTEIWESDLALVTRQHQGDGVVDGFVLDAATGEPIANAKIETFERDRGNLIVEGKSTTTDRNGMFRFDDAHHRIFLLLATHGEHSLSSENFLSAHLRPPYEPQSHMVLFTDRAIYRPGQTIHFKGVAYNVDTQSDEYRTLPKQSINVVLNDANNQEVERLQLQTNDYGSLSGSFTAPSDRLMGQMSIQIDEGPRGAAWFSVEEYKRPKFQVELSGPDQSPRLGEQVIARGTATSYTGSSIDGAEVRYRVVRQVRFPYWWYSSRYFPGNSTSDQEIANGVTETNAQGQFTVEFTAKPDPTIDRDSQPTFQYTVFADVTDRTGETRSDQTTISIGYTTLATELSAEEWQTDEDPVEITIKTKTLDGQPQNAEGQLTVYRLEQPEQVQRPPLNNPFSAHSKPAEPDLVDPTHWPLGEVVAEQTVKTDASGTTTEKVTLERGLYRAVLIANDRTGTPVRAELQIRVLDPDADDLEIRVPNVFAVKQRSVEPSEEFTAIWGSGYDQARAFIEIECDGKILQSYWTEPKKTQELIKQQIRESMRGGFTIRSTMVRENRAYMETHVIEVPWTNKELKISWEHFVSKLKPAEQETWTAIIEGPDAERHVAEMVATLYDASLDAFRQHNWPSQLGGFRREYPRISQRFENDSKYLHLILTNWNIPAKEATLLYGRLPEELVDNLQRYEWFNRRGRGLGVPEAAMSMDGAMGGGGMGGGIGAPMDSMMMEASNGALEGLAAKGGAAVVQDTRVNPQDSNVKQVDLDQVSVRKNLNETAFFYPHLISNEEGVVKLEFTMPEALTEWRFFGFAHDADMRSGLITGSTVTAKDLMIQPNPPRFVREGDQIEMTVKVSNQSATRQSGIVKLTFNQARTEQSADQALGNNEPERSFDVAAGQSQSLSWRITIPDGIGFLTYKAVGSTGKLSDGEEGFLPVLTRRVLVTESLPLPIRDASTKEFSFEKLLQSANSDSLKHQAFTVQMVSNPSWYAVMALPYLMEYPYECTEQTFNRLYANALGRYIAMSDPKIERVFEQWRGTDALDSPLEKNEEIKAVLLEETPWVRQANDESQARRNVGILFEQNRMNRELSRTMNKLVAAQLPDGAWPWFPGGSANDFITLYITTGFGRLRHLGVEVDIAPAVRSLARLDNWVSGQYRGIKEEDRDAQHLTPLIAYYLYGRSFYLNDRPIDPVNKEAFDYWVKQGQTYWLDVAHRQSQAHLAVALHRLGKSETADAIMESLRQRSVIDEEMGMYWRDLELSWWWYRAPIETQAMMIEAFDEVADDAKAVELCKVWLLKQKQAQDWKTTKATADAIYALLLRGTDLLASNKLVEVYVAGQPIEPVDVEAGTGFFEQRFGPGEVQPEMGNIKLVKKDPGVAWGSAHWQYLEDMAKVTPHEATPLQLTKQLYVREYTKEGPVLERVTGPVEVGDELVVRLVLRTDRDMEYVHLKDYRGSGTEPIDVLSHYRYQDGLGYYMSTRDTATHFFIDYLPKGTYVFEYSTFVQLEGEYQTGYANIQCMYAPEFNSHSESLSLKAE